MKYVVRLCILLTLLLAAGHVMLTQLAGFLTQEIFAQGSGCYVELHRPKVRYFPLRASVEDVRIFHPDEGAESGFRASKVSVQLEFSALFRKKIVLNELHIADTWLESIGEDTALIQVIKFLFQRPKKPKSSADAWHSALSSGWGVWVQHVRIETPKQSHPQQVRIGTNEVIAEADRVVFTTEDSSPVRGQPVAMGLEGDGMRLRIAGSPPLPLEEFVAKGTMVRGELTVNQAVVSAKNARVGRKSKVQGEGKLHFGEIERYDFTITGTLFDDYLAALVFPYSELLEPTAPRAELKMSLTGGLKKPTFDGELSVAFDKEGALFFKERCALKSAKGHFTVSADGVQVRTLTVEDVVEDAEFNLRFTSALPFTAKVAIELATDSPYVQRCIPSRETKDGRSDALTPFSQAVHQALANSSTKITASGSLAAQEGIAVIESEIYRRSHYAHSFLNAQVALADASLHVTAQEQGVIPQIAGAARAEDGAQETRFSIEDPSSISLDATYSLVDKLLFIEQLEMHRYPADRIAARIAPFLSETQYGKLEDIFSEKSDVSASLRGSIATDFERSDAKGTLRLQNVRLGPLDVQAITTPITVAPGLLQLQEIEVTTPGGSIQAEMEFARGGVITGAARTAALNSSAFTTAATVLEQFETTLFGSAQITGTTANPLLNANISAESRYANQGGLESSISVRTDRQGVAVEGRLLENHAKFSGYWPLVSGKDIALSADFDEFPLPTMGRKDARAPESSASVSASLEYTAAYSSPYSGSGNLRIAHLQWPELQLAVAKSRPMQAQIVDGALRFDDVRLQVDDKELFVRGTLSPQEGWDLQVRGGWELGALSGMVQSLEQVSGNLEMEMQVFGELLQPELNGYLDLKDGSLSFFLANSVVGLSSAEARVRFDRETAKLERFSAALGDGRIRMEGGVRNLFTPITRDLELRIFIDDGRVEPRANLNVQFDAQLVLSQTGSAPARLSGDVDIAEARYEKRVELAQLIRALTRTILGAERTRVEGSLSRAVPLSLDIRVQAPNGLLVETDLGSGELRGELLVSGPASQPQVDGQVEVLTGTFELGLNTFDIIDGKIVFESSGGMRLDPKLAILAETVVETASREEHLIRMSIRGTLSNPEVKFTSDSGLTENEIVAFFGLGGRGLEVLTVREDRSFREILDPRSDLSLRERLVGITGFRDVLIESGLSEDTGEFVPRVRARRPLLGKSRLEVSSELSGEQISEAEIQYPLTEELDVTAGWRSRPVTEDVTTTQGSYSFGIRFQRQFLGTSIIPNFLDFGNQEAE